MTESKLRNILEGLRREQSDNRMFEVKTAMVSFPLSAAKTICAFANMPGGGTILFGVDENSGFTVTGVYDPVNCRKTIASYAQKEYSVPVLVETSVVAIDG